MGMGILVERYTNIDDHSKSNNVDKQNDGNCDVDNRFITHVNSTIRTWTRGQRHSRLLSIPNSSKNVDDIATNDNDIQENILNRDELRSRVYSTNPLLVVSTESWLNSAITDRDVVLSNYMYYRVYCCCRRGGELIPYIHCSILATLLKAKSSDDVETLWPTIFLPNHQCVNSA
ncbi:hypothetical protein GJ496_005731 [Pomphorhynchus laevis]|nr:hypothetical protein GJ496_005731 [Pomphorhynchus laevis]